MFDTIKGKIDSIYKKSQVLYIEDTDSFIGFGGVIFCIKNPCLGKNAKSYDMVNHFAVFSARGDNGFISPNGELYYITPESHEFIAKNVFKEKNKDDLLKKGWLSLSFDNDCNILFIQGNNHECNLHRKGFTGDLKFSELSQSHQNTLYDILSVKAYKSFFSPNDA